MAWNPNEKGNPAWLTKQASEHGGVENFMNDIHNAGYQEGHNDGLRFGFLEGSIGASLFGLVSWGIYEFVKHHRDARKEALIIAQNKSVISRESIKKICEEPNNYEYDGDDDNEDY